jgi:hypothetical protein
MDEVHKPISTQYYTPSSKPFRTLILSVHICIGRQNSLFPSGLLTKIFFMSSKSLHCMQKHTIEEQKFVLSFKKTCNVSTKVTMTRFRVTIVVREKQIRTTYSERVSVALVMHRAKRMRCIILSSVAYPALPYFSTLSQKGHDFRRGGGELLNIKYMF